MKIAYIYYTLYFFFPCLIFMVVSTWRIIQSGMYDLSKQRIETEETSIKDRHLTQCQ